MKIDGTKLEKWLKRSEELMADGRNPEVYKLNEYDVAAWIKQNPKVANRFLNAIEAACSSNYTSFPEHGYFGKIFNAAVKTNPELADRVVDIILSTETGGNLVDIALLAPLSGDRYDRIMNALSGDELLYLAEETDNAWLRNKAVNTMYSDTKKTPCLGNSYTSSTHLCKIAEKGFEEDTMVKLLRRLANELSFVDKHNKKMSLPQWIILTE